MKLEETLAALRKKQGLTQAELAEILGVSRQAVSKWEVGEALPSVENLKNLSQLYHISLDDLLREGELPEPKAPPENQTEPGKEMPAVEEALPQKPSRRKKVVIALLLGWAAVLSISIMAGYLWWNSQPAQQFLYWNEGESSSSPAMEGRSLSIEVNRFSDGSGSITYTVTNLGQETFLCSPIDWIDYYYQGAFHCITEPNRSVPASSWGGGVPLDAGESLSKTRTFPSKGLALPGRYRYCIKDVGQVEFAVFEDGSVLVGK